MTAGLNLKKKSMRRTVNKVVAPQMGSIMPQSKTVSKNRPPRKPSAYLPPDVDKFWSDLEWFAPEYKLPPGWKNRQWKRLARVGREIAEDDRRELEKERQRAQLSLAELRQDMQDQIEKDRKHAARLKDVESIEKDRSEDSAATWKYLDALAAAIQKRRDSNAAWLADAKKRLVEATRQINADIVSSERKEFIRRGVLRGRRPKPLTPDDLL
jgi:hypothetical protein